MDSNIIKRASFEFALEIIKLSESLESQRKYVVANQVLKSGCSIGANVREAQNAESKLDFIHKLKVAIKEAEETEYWLLLCNHSESYPDTTHLIEQVRGIIKILGKIISTSKKRLNMKSAN